MLTKNRMITLKTKTTYHLYVIDAEKVTKPLFMFSTIVETEKKYGTHLNL